MPGGKNMGIAILFTLFGVPMLISLAAGLLCLIIGAIASAYARFFPQLQIDPLP
jgi:hypothetical protein